MQCFSIILKIDWSKKITNEEKGTKLNIVNKNIIKSLIRKQNL